MARVLVVDDEASMRRILAAIVEEDGHVVVQAEGVKTALETARDGDFDVVLTDQKMEDGLGTQLLTQLLELDATLPVVLITAFATVDLAVDAMRHGAFDFITKPFQPDVIRAAVTRAVGHGALLRENIRLRTAVNRMDVASDLVGESAGMKRVKEHIAKVAPLDVTVLIQGETGTGKELVARAIHRASPRKDKPFVAVNCAALQESLLESELFGHEKGAFTGADKARQGLFEAASGGTLFLDEAGEMSLALQAKLLRVLMDKQVTRVGSTRPRKADVRVLVATHRDLEQRVKEGEFREDLYYRVNVVPVAIPPLRDRAEDLPMLVDYFLQTVGKELKLPSRRMADAAVRKLAAYKFPGNVRELRNLIERAYILSSGEEILPRDLPIEEDSSGEDSVRGADGIVARLPHELDLRDWLSRLEQALLKRALRDASGVQAEAGRLLGLSRSDVAYKMKKYGMSE